MNPKPTLPDLVSHCLHEGDENAWRELVEYLQPHLAGVVARSAFRWGPVQPEVVEDLTQEAFLKLCKDGLAILRKIEGHPEGSMLAFLKVTAASLVHDHFRAIRSAKQFPPGGFLTSDALDEWLGETQTIDAMERELLLNKIDRILSQELAGETAVRDRQVFWFHHRHGMTARAIASMPAIGLSEKGVESALFRLTLLVRTKLVAAKGIVAGGTYT